LVFGSKLSTVRYLEGWTIVANTAAQKMRKERVNAYRFDLKDNGGKDSNRKSDQGPYEHEAGVGAF